MVSCFGKRTKLKGCMNLAHPNRFHMIKGNLSFAEQLKGSESPEDTVQFQVLLRKNNKPAYKEVAVPRESDIAKNLQMQEEADRLEKERVKQLTLEINERQEEEEFTEAMAAVSCLMSLLPFIAYGIFLQQTLQQHGFQMAALAITILDIC